MPAGLEAPLEAMWLDARGEWEAAHMAAQGDESAEAAWVHAYLHRKEGDESNAGYWYKRAGQDMPNLSLEDEWERIVGALLEQGSG